MRIAYVCEPFDAVLSPKEGSIGVITRAIARRLARSNQVTVYARSWLRSRTVVQDGVTYKFVPTLFERVWVKLLEKTEKIWNFRGGRPFFFGESYHFFYAWQVARDLRRTGADLIHVHNFSQYCPLFRSVNPAAKIVLHMNCEWLSQLGPQVMEKRLRDVDLILGASESVSQKIRSCFPEIGDRCATQYNGVDVDVFTPARSRGSTREKSVKRLLFVGRVSPEKGVHVLIEAFREVVKQYPQTVLEIIGPPWVLQSFQVEQIREDDIASHLAPFYARDRRVDYGTVLRQLVGSELSGKVNFLGPIEHSRLAEYYRNADVAVFPSIWNEPMALVLLEAMASGVPMVTTRVGGIVETVQDGETGLLVERGDPHALAQAILRVLGNESLAVALGAGARQAVLQKFSWDVVSNELLGRYQHLLTAGRTA